MGKRSKNFKLNNSNKNKNKNKNKNNIEVKDERRIIGWIGNEIPIYGSKAMAMNEFRVNDISPIITNHNKRILYNRCAFNKFPEYKENTDIWGNETSRSLIHVLPQYIN